MAEPLASAANIGWRLQVFTGFFIPLQIIAVALRFYARWLVIGTKFALDDGIVLITLAFQLTLSVVGVASVTHAGVGHHLAYLEEHDPTKLLAWGKYLLAIATLYFADINLPKLAILILYRRLFPMRTVQILVYALAGILISASLANTIVSLAACKPFEANYNPSLPGGKCIDKESFFVWTSIPNIFTDVVMLILPLPIVWNLHNTKRIKVALTFTFLVGSFGLVTSILRFHTFFVTNSFRDGTYDAVELIIWTVTEPGIYLISACLMTYRPLLERVAGSRPMATLRGSKLQGRSRLHAYGKGQSGEGSSDARSIPLRKMNKGSMGFTELGDDGSSTADMVGASSPSSDLENGRITVTTDIENSWSHT